MPQETEEKREYLYVMDYCDPSIVRIDVTDVEDDDIDRILKPYGFKSESCAYMYTDKLIEYIEDGDEYLAD